MENTTIATVSTTPGQQLLQYNWTQNEICILLFTSFTDSLPGKLYPNTTMTENVLFISIQRLSQPNVKTR